MKITETIDVGSGTLSGLQTIANPRADAEKELRKAAAAHRVNIEAERMLTASNPTTTILHAPILDIERYGDADFAAGAPVLLLIIKSSTPQGMPNGAYVVKAQYRSGATSGKALFTNPKGVIVARRDLIVRTLEQSAVLFPSVYSGDPAGGDPVEIPVITSTHVWHTNHWAVDCAGWQPYRVLYF